MIINRRNIGFFIFFVFAILFCFKTINAQPDGENLFKTKCAACHTIKTKLLGPPLEGVLDRVPSREWVYSWVRNSQKMISEGDEYGVARFEMFNKIPMLSFPDMTNEEIDSVLSYINKAASIPDEVASDTGSGQKISVREVKVVTRYDYLMIFTVLVGVILGVVILIGTALVPSERKKQHFHKRGILYKITGNRVIILLSLIFVGSISYNLIDSAMRLGRSPGYMPKQPMFFSHKVHAGDNKINCQYCHSTVEKSKQASIPSVNVCMNCHKAIKTFSGNNLLSKEEGTAEIEKIYASFDNNKPLEWIKVHNLPDHVFFSHAQHFKIAGIECAKCHGPVEEMDELYQFAPLSMGWCVNCHRDTEVTQFKDNDYYAIYTDLHNDLSQGNSSTITAENLGGIDCQKCHY